MTRRRLRHLATGVLVSGITGLLAVAVRGLPADVRWALLLVIAPYLLGGVLLVMLPAMAWVADSLRDPVSPG